MSDAIKLMGWGNQDRVAVHADGRLSPPPDQLDPLASPLLAAGDGLYRAARIVNDQLRSPFEEGRISQDRVLGCIRWITDLLTTPPRELAEMSEGQAHQLRASAGVVLLSLAESQAGRRSEDAQRIIRAAMDTYFQLLEAEEEPVLIERLSMNLDWIIPSLPEDLAGRAQAEMEARIPRWPPYDSWFADGNTGLNIDWKCGPEFIDGWIRRLTQEGFALEQKGGAWSDNILTRTFTYQGVSTQVRMSLGPEREDVFRRMDEPGTHVVGYDGHSDWGRRIPQSLERAPRQAGAKVILYLLCSGKQILQKVKDVYPQAHVVTTFNSARFTKDFAYSEDFTAFMHILRGFSRRQSWEEIRKKVNGDWHNNPEKNYIFPIEALAMARSLDQDHDGQADVFDRLLDFNTFAVERDTRAEFIPRRPERGPHELVGTALHLGVQVFHTLAHFNQLLEPFTHDLRVFSEGWFDPQEPLPEGDIALGPIRIHLGRGEGGYQYHARCSHHHAHASEEAWRAMLTLALTVVVMGKEQRYAQLPPHHALTNALTMVAHGLEVDDAPGRDEAVWQGMRQLMELPPWLDRQRFTAVKGLDYHWYAGSRRSLSALDQALRDDQVAELGAWLARRG